MFWISREVRYQHEAHPGGLVGAYLIGLAFAFGWTPCIGPVLGTILTIAASEQDVMKGAGLLAVYSAGPRHSLHAGGGRRRHLHGLHVAASASIWAWSRRWRARCSSLSGLMFITGGVQAVSYWLIERFPVLLNLG